MWFTLLITLFLKHEATGSTATLAGWDASPSQGYPLQYVGVTHLHTWVKRDNVEQSLLSEENNSNKETKLASTQAMTP